ncbi:hypothetical protein [Trueperella bernardiae]|uniref:hypothetical protein n=1 Tax=Trueperella bernardiae TaxID=59561 RepID=UPI0023EFEC07|nr:hypothetical protein [Trueperella bernardiae]
MNVNVLALASILLTGVVTPDGTTVDWGIDAGGGAINIDASNTRWDGTVGSNGGQSGVPATGVGHGSGGDTSKLQALTVDEMCDQGYWSNTGASYFESGRMSGPLAEYCLYRTPKEPGEAGESDAAAPAPQMTVADLGYYIQANAQTIIDGGVMSLQPASGQVVINKPVYFASSAAHYTTSVTVLGTQVELAFTPSSYEWLPGDGSSFVSSDPGGTYPDGGVTYTYTQPGAYTPSVRVGWEVLIRVAGSPGWYPVPGQALTTVTSEPLTAVEAEAVLTANR